MLKIVWRKFSTFFCPIKYPKRLLPQKNYRIISCGKDIFNENTLTRHTEEERIYLEGTNALDPDVIGKFPSEQLCDLSNNLLGIFREDDVCFSITGSQKQIFIGGWKEGDKVTIPRYKRDFEITTGRKNLFLKMKEVSECEIPYENPKGKETLRFQIEHTPSVCNFWHFSISVILADGKKVSDLELSSSAKKKYYRAAKNVLVRLFFVENPPVNVLERKHYIKLER